MASADFTHHVADVVRRAHRLGPVVLVGQSVGGLTLNTVANRPTGQPANRVHWRSGDPEFPRVVREGMAADRTDDEVRTLLNILEPDESAQIGAADTRGLPGAWGRIPRTYLRFTEDRTIPPELQDLMIEEADELTPENRFHVRSLAAPHISPRDPGELAAELELELELVAGLCHRGSGPPPGGLEP